MDENKADQSQRAHDAILMELGRIACYAAYLEDDLCAYTLGLIDPTNRSASWQVLAGEPFHRIRDLFKRLLISRIGDDPAWSEEKRKSLERMLQQLSEAYDKRNGPIHAAWYRGLKDGAPQVAVWHGSRHTRSRGKFFTGPTEASDLKAIADALTEASSQFRFFMQAEILAVFPRLYSRNPEVDVDA